MKPCSPSPLSPDTTQNNNTIGDSPKRDGPIRVMIIGGGFTVNI